MSRCFINARSLVSTARCAILLELATTRRCLHTRKGERLAEWRDACMRTKERVGQGTSRRQRTCAPFFSIGGRRQPRALLSNRHYARRLQQCVNVTSSKRTAGGSTTKELHDALSTRSSGSLAEITRSQVPQLPPTSVRSRRTKRYIAGCA